LRLAVLGDGFLKTKKALLDVAGLFFRHLSAFKWNFQEPDLLISSRS